MKHYILCMVLLLLISSSEISAQQSYSDVSLEEKIGQMLIMGFRGSDVNEGNPIHRDITELNIGGVVLYDSDISQGGKARNIQSPSQLKLLTKNLKELSEQPLLIAVDQEGGKVRRLKPSDGFPKTRSHAILGGRDNEELTPDEATKIAETLNESGINLNFAPVVDLRLESDNKIITALNRSFGKDPDLVAKHAGIYIDVHNENSVLTTLKHFPGYGSFNGATYNGISDVTQTWQRVELDPYKELINNGTADAIMVSLIYNGQLDEKYPATMSKATVDELLRNQMGFDGLVIAESPQNENIRDQYGFETALKLTINAGADMIQFANNTWYQPDIAQRVIDTVTRMVENGEIPEERINEAYGRIMEFKNRL